MGFAYIKPHFSPLKAVIFKNIARRSTSTEALIKFSNEKKVLQSDAKVLIPCSFCNYAYECCVISWILGAEISGIDESV